MNKKVAAAVAIILVVVIAVAVVFLFPRPLPEQKELDFNVSGQSPDVCYIPFRTGKDERWNLTIQCLEMPSELAWVTISRYNGYWDKGANYKCSIDDLAPLATELTVLQTIGADPEIQEKYPTIANYNSTVYTDIYGSSTPQSFTVFVPFPSGGEGKFHIKLEKVE